MRDRRSGLDEGDNKIGGSERGHPKAVLAHLQLVEERDVIS